MPSNRIRGLTEPFPDYSPQQQYNDEFQNFQQQQQLQQLLMQLQQQAAQQQYQNQAQPIYNANDVASAQAQLAGTQYGLGNDVGSLGLQVKRGEEEIKQTRDRGETDLAQQRLSNERYLQSLIESVARENYQRSVSPTQSPFMTAARQFGY